MDRKVDETKMMFSLKTEDDCDENKMTTSASVPLASQDELNGLEVIWTKTDVFHVSVVSVLMLLTFLGNSVVIITIVSRAELRQKRVNVFILNLAVGDLMVCFVSMPTHILMVVFDQWVLGAVACKLLVYGHIVSMASTTLLLTAMSIDKYQVFLVLYATRR